MIRPLTCLCVLLAGGSGLYLYQSKHRAQVLDREIESTVHAAQAARERTGILKAEWTLLNDPERLGQLADRFLALKTMTPGQFTTMAELGNRLPAIRPPDAKPTDPAPIEPAAEPLPPIAEAPAPAAAPKVAAAAKPAPERVATAARSAQSTDRATADRSSAMKVAMAQPVRPADRAGDRMPGVERAVEHHPTIAPTMVSASVPRPSMGYLVPPHIAAARPMPQVSPVQVSSSLGMARSSLPPPVPYGDFNASSGNGN